MNTMKKYEISRIRNDDDLDASENEAGQPASVIIDNGNNIVQLCPLAERWFGYKSQDIIGQHFKTLAASTFDYPKPIQQQEMIQNERTIRVTFRHKTGYFFPGTITIKDITSDNQELFQHPITPWSHNDSEAAQGLLGDNTLTEQFELAGKMGGWQLDVVSNQVSWTDGVYAIFAIDKGEDITPEHILYYFHEAQPRIRAAFRRCLTSGESFSISDPDEVWILEMIGKGEGEKGAVWVAQRIPDGFISGHANQARITTFPLNDSKNCVYSKDVISFAREKGWYSGTNKDFSFSDVIYHFMNFDKIAVLEYKI